MFGVMGVEALKSGLLLYLAMTCNPTIGNTNHAALWNGQVIMRSLAFTLTCSLFL